MFTREMQKALEADGEKLRQLAGEDHGPRFQCERCKEWEQMGLSRYCPSCDADNLDLIQPVP